MKTETPPKKKARTWVTATIVVVLVILVAWVTQTLTSVEPLTAYVDQVAGGFRIKNADSYDWTDVKFILNERWTLDAYYLKAGQEFPAPYSQFTDEHGVMFPTRAARVETLVVETEQGSYTSRW